MKTTYFSEIGKTISNVLTKDFKLDNKATVSGQGFKAETTAQKSQLLHKTTITREILGDGILSADVVFDVKKHAITATLTNKDAILKGMKVDVKLGNVSKIAELKQDVLEKATIQCAMSGVGIKVEVPLPSPKTCSVNFCSDVFGNGTSVGIDSTVSLQGGGVENYALAVQKKSDDVVYALALDNRLDRMKFGMAANLDKSLTGAIECVVGRSSGSLAYAVGLQNGGSRAVYNSAGTIDMSHEHEICEGVKATVVCQAHLASKTYKTGVSFDVKA